MGYRLTVRWRSDCIPRGDACCGRRRGGWRGKGKSAEDILYGAMGTWPASMDDLERERESNEDKAVVA
jgi:hypothetical protein